ncbi:MAG: anti-sigma factor antagonist [Armatimonadota bacterium]
MVHPTVQIKLSADIRDELEVNGEIDYHTAPELRQAITRYYAEGGGNLRLQLEGVEFIDSTGLSVLLDAVKTARGSGWAITLIRPSEQLLRVLSVSGFAPFFDVEYKESAAVEDSRPVPVPLDELSVETFEAEGRPENIGNLRRSVIGFAKKLPFTQLELNDIKLAVGEATSNALRYGCHSGKETIRVTVTRKGHRFSVQITDPGPGFDPNKVPAVNEGELAEGGRGIFFMRCLMDEVNYTFDRAGTTVELVKHIPADRFSSDN